jgi:carbonic anhydrase
MLAPLLERTSTDVEVASPAGDEEWRQVRALLNDFSTWFESVAGMSFASVQAETDEDLTAPETFYSRPGCRFFVAKVDGRIVGTTAIRPLNLHVIEIKRVYVDPEARGLGAASRMLEAAIDEARRFGARRVVLESHSVYMAGAVRLYRKRGFYERPDYTNLAEKVPGVIAMEMWL